MACLSVAAKLTTKSSSSALLGVFSFMCIYAWWGCTHAHTRNLAHAFPRTERDTFVSEKKERSRIELNFNHSTTSTSLYKVRYQFLITVYNTIIAAFLMIWTNYLLQSVGLSQCSCMQAGTYAHYVFTLRSGNRLSPHQPSAWHC